MCRVLALSLVLCLIGSELVNAGTLSRSREEVRDQAKHDDSEDRNRRKSSGKLSEARKEVRDEDRKHDRPRRGSGHHAPCLPACGSVGFFAFSQPCPPVVETVVVKQPMYVVEPVNAPPTYMEPLGPSLAASFCRQFAPYPYADGAQGFMLVDSPGVGQSWSGRVQVERGSDLADIDRTGFAILLEGESGFGIDFDWDSYTEDLAGGEHDELHVGEVDLLYRIVESDQLMLRAGLGVAWLGDAYDTNTGINFTLKADYAPCDPLLLSGELDLGTLGDAEHLHAVGTLGVLIRRCEFYGGYDYRRIGDVEIQGPMLGLRLWF